MNILLLNDDCLRSVFRHLTFRERLKSETVCRRLRSIMPYDDISTLDLTVKDIFWPKKFMPNWYPYPRVKRGRLSLDYFFSYRPLADSWMQRIFIPILNRSGQFVKEILAGKEAYLIDDMQIQCWEFTTEMISRDVISSCPNVEKFQYQGDLHSGCIPLFLEWPHLRILHLNIRNVLGDDEQLHRNLYSSLILHPKLEELKLENFILHSPFTTPPGVDCAQKSHLKKLELLPCGVRDMSALPDVCPKLVSLCLSYERYSYPQTISSRIIGELVNLENLTISNACLDDLATICENLNITKFSITRTKYMLGMNFSPLKLLTKLSELEINGGDSKFPQNQPENFTDETLIHISHHGQLKKLVARNCRITNKGVCIVGELCSNLTELDLAYNRVLTNVGFVCVMENCKNLQILDARYTKVSNQLLGAVGAMADKLEVLRVCVYNCLVNREGLIDESSFLQLYTIRSPRMSTENFPLLTIYVDLQYSQLMCRILIERLKEVCKVVIQEI